MNLSTPRLTIVMPAYNADKYIVEAVESLINQTFGDFVIWIIDDGSSDRTCEVMSRMNDERISKIYHKLNRGRVEVVNEIVSKIETEYFTITDADDVSHPDRLKQQIDLLDNAKEIMMCGTAYFAMDEKGYLIRKMNLNSEYEVIYNRILVQSQFHGPTTIMRREIINHFPTLYRQYFKDNVADSDLAARIVDQYKVVNISKQLYYYRIVRSSLSRKNFSARFVSLDKVIAFLSEERRRSGSDSLMENDGKKVDAYLEELTGKYKDPSLLCRHAAFYNLYWKVNDVAWQNALSAMRIAPLQLKNFLLLVYIAAMISYNRILKSVVSQHYSTHIKKSLAS